MERKSYYALDVAKFISAFLVIGIHTGPLLDINTDANFVVVQILARIAVPFFFITSGFLFYQKIDASREWNDYENICVLKHYIGRLCKIYVIWTILYLPFTYWIMHSGDGVSMEAILRFVRDFFFTGSFYHLWFLPSLMLAVVLIYFMVAKLNIYKTLLLALILYSIGMLGNVYPKLMEDIPVVSTVFKGYLDIFVTTRNGLFFGPIFIALGAYFAIRKIYLKNYVILIGLIVSLVLLFVECNALRDAGFMSDLASMYLMLIPSVTCLFLLLTRVHLRKRRVYRTMRTLSLLIYVSHIMFVSILLWTLPEMNSLLLYLISVLCSVIMSYLILCSSKRITIFKQLY